jgi:hypothetical protein
VAAVGLVVDLAAAMPNGCPTPATAGIIGPPCRDLPSHPADPPVLAG